MIERVLVTAGFVLALSACTPVATIHRGHENPWTQPGVLRLGEPDEPDNLNPMFGHTAATDLADGLLFSFILRYDDNGNYVPDLAIEVPARSNGGISRDGKTITVHLRRDVRWSDGMPLTARDWLFTYRAVMNSRNDVKTRYGWDDIASAETPDTYTIVVHLKQANAAFLGVFAMGGSAYPPLPEHLLGKLPDINEAPFNEHPLSSGPYVLTAWNHGSSLTFAPNPEYLPNPHFLAKNTVRYKAKLQKIVWLVIPDVTTLFNELRAHDIDVYANVDESSIARLGNISDITVSQKLIGNWRRLMFNTSKPPLNDPRVRLAIAEAIDWNRINATVYHGYNPRAVSDIYPASWAAPAIPRYLYDPTNAARLLDAAGWKPPAGDRTSNVDGVFTTRERNGIPLHLQISTGTNKLENAQAEVVVQQMLHQVGIDVEIRNYPVSLLFAQDGPLYSGRYDMEWSVDTNGPDPDNSGSWNGAFVPPRGANTAWINDPQINRLSDAAVRTYDIGQRRKLYQREEERIHELVPMVPFYWENAYFAMNSDVKNYKPAAFIADSWNAWEWSI